jgi:hypothetical protein
MKKALLLVVVMFSMTMGAFAQGNSNGDQQLINKARVAAQQAGCLSDWNGQVLGDITVVSSCFAGGFVTEVLIFPVCHGQTCPYVRLSALAKVTFYCTDEVGSVECL